MTDLGLPSTGPVIRVALALVLTTGLLLFLAAMRTLDRQIDAPVMTFRTLDTTDPVSLPEPPPPSAEITPPAPPVTPDLPTLELAVDSIAPPVKANLTPEMNMDLTLSEFATETEQPRERMIFGGNDLDTKPQLVFRPGFTFPESQRQRGVTRARVVLKVAINTAGKVRVLGVVDSPHPDFTEIAKTLAKQSKFSAPTRDGRLVETVFNWPMDFTP